MAADSREPSNILPPSQDLAKSSRNHGLGLSSSSPSSTPDTSRERPYDGKIYETFDNSSSSLRPDSVASASPTSTFSPPENANAIPGGATNTAGGRVKEATLWDGLKSIKLQDVKDFHKKPCVRDALLVGMGSGFALGGGRMVFGASMWHSMSWAMGSFCFSSAGMYEFCQRRRAMERQLMLKAAEVIDRKKVEKERQMEKIRAERRLKREEEERKKEEERERRRKGGWSFWGGG